MRQKETKLRSSLLQNLEKMNKKISEWGTVKRRRSPLLPIQVLPLLTRFTLSLLFSISLLLTLSFSLSFHLLSFSLSIFPLTLSMLSFSLSIFHKWLAICDGTHTEHSKEFASLTKLVKRENQRI